MRKIINYISIVIAAIAVQSCNKDLDITTYNEGDAIPALLKAVGQEYILDAQTPADTVITFNWDEADMGYDAAVTNRLEMDITGEKFAKMVTLGSINRGGTFAITHADLNNIIISLLESYELSPAATKFEFRVSSSLSEFTNAVYSNVITSEIEPFVGERVYPSIAIRGDYSGWDFNKSQKIYSVDSDNNYAGMIYFDGKSANGWKLCETEDWSVSWGADNTATPEQSPIILAGGDNISIFSKNSYFFKFDKTTKTFVATKPHDSWGLVGVINNWGGSPDVVMSLGTELNLVGGTEHFLTVTADFAAASQWKIRPDNIWADDVNPGNSEGDFSQDGGNFVMTDAGNYTIKWYFNKVTQIVKVIKN